MPYNKLLKELVDEYKFGRDLYSIIRKNSQLLDWINTIVPDADTLPAKVYSIIYDIDPICEYGNKKPFFNSWAGFRLCGRKDTCKCWKENQSKKVSAAKSKLSQDDWDNIIEKRKQTNQEKYGTAFAVQNDDIKAKVASNNIEKYGVKTTLLVPEVKEKIKESLLDKHGVDHPMKSAEIKASAMNTCLDRYGHVVFPHSAEGRKVVRSTLKDKYNVASIAQLKFSQPVRDLLQDVDKFCLEYYKIGINGLCEKYPELNYEMCRVKLLRHGITDVIRYSKPEAFIKDFLNELSINYEFNSHKIIPPQELDFYIPSHNLAIEVCGLYWHRHELLKNSNYHVEKLEKCLDVNINLLTIFSDQIESSPDIVKNRILSKLKLIPRTHHARKLLISNSTQLDRLRSFLNNNHLQGTRVGSVNLSAIDSNDQLCAVMTFGKLRNSLGHKSSKIGEYEMYRFASAGNIPGIASKMFSYFVKNYNPSTVISYADRCWGEGHLYTALGFDKSIKNGPNYWYSKDHRTKLHRYNFTKHSLVKAGYDPNKTEFEIMEELGYSRIYDCGSNKYVWNNDINI